MTSNRTLDTLKAGDRARISRIVESSPHFQRIMEMGLTEGAEIELAFEAPFGGTVAVRCRGSIIALRLEDAAHIEVAAP